MTTLRTRGAITGLVVILCFATIGLLLTPPAVSEEGGAAVGQGRPGPRRTPREPLEPEKLKEIWSIETKCAAAAAEIKGEDVEKVVKAFVAAQQAYSEKVQELPRSREGFQQRQEIATKANADLKEAFTKAVGDKAEKVAGLLAPVGTMGLRVDRMVGTLIDFKLPKEKLGKAVMALMENSRDQAKLFTEARESGSFDGVREKMQALTESLNKKLSAILTEEQMTQWNESYGRRFGPRGAGAGGRRPSE